MITSLASNFSATRVKNVHWDVNYNCQDKHDNQILKHFEIQGDSNSKVVKLAFSAWPAATMPSSFCFTMRQRLIYLLTIYNIYI